MTDPRFIPNSYQTPNVLVDEIMPLLTPEEWVILSFATRKILGWQNRIASRQDTISLSQFQQSGLSRPAVMNALDELSKYGLLNKIGNPTPKGQLWELSYDDQVDLEGLIARKSAKHQRGLDRTQIARSVGLTGQSDLPVSGQSDLPAGGQSDLHTKHTDQTHSKTQESLARNSANDLAEQKPTAKGKSRRPSTPSSGAPPSPTGEAKPIQPHVAIIDAWRSALGDTAPIARNIYGGEYGKVAVALAQYGITPDEIYAFTCHAMSDPFWLGKVVTLQYIAKNILSWRKAQKGTVNHERPAKPDGADGEAKQPSVTYGKGLPASFLARLRAEGKLPPVQGD